MHAVPAAHGMSFQDDSLITKAALLAGFWTVRKVFFGAGKIH